MLHFKRTLSIAVGFIAAYVSIAAEFETVEVGAGGDVYPGSSAPGLDVLAERFFFVDASAVKERRKEFANVGAGHHLYVNADHLRRALAGVTESEPRMDDEFELTDDDELLFGDYDSRSGYYISEQSLARRLAADVTNVNLPMVSLIPIDSRHVRSICDDGSEASDCEYVMNVAPYRRSLQEWVDLEHEHVISGGCEGCDVYVAQSVLRRKLVSADGDDAPSEIDKTEFWKKYEDWNKGGNDLHYAAAGEYLDWLFPKTAAPRYLTILEYLLSIEKDAFKLKEKNWDEKTPYQLASYASNGKPGLRAYQKKIAGLFAAKANELGLEEALWNPPTKSKKQKQ